MRYRVLASWSPPDTATRAEVSQALKTALTGFTHLFNAMSPPTVREPGVAGAALDHPESWCSVIVDSYQVDPVVLRLTLRAKRLDRFMLVTHAMPSVGTDQKSLTCSASRSPRGMGYA